MACLKGLTNGSYAAGLPEILTIAHTRAILNGGEA